ncbi:hypothetical protein [Paenibacillus abyssi]|uniref:Uncharacterized protein n=1 Tax=Paenibacillus abyssi TaxID=1340531 RepID=A0A917FY20_9BACL|nr:hypothetical protein [Paenibacillus abyssi]GGG13555.1 hypothetical protein GCM10010916_33090 [Paenibacillus abyssi]
MEKKRCLFCNETVEVETIDDCDWYISCCCSPDGSYGLHNHSFEFYQSLSYETKRQMFPIISAHIREQTDCGETVALAGEDLNAIETDPRRPVTIEDKGYRLLQYLHRHTSKPGEPVVIRQLSKSFNLTYSPNLQELVYIITKLMDEKSLEREGSTFKLTEKGWREAVASGRGRSYKPCVVLLPDVDKQRPEWSVNVLPTIEQCGYLPHVIEKAEAGQTGDHMEQLLSKCKLVIADLTGHSPEVYFAAGLALGMNKTVIWTLPHGEANRLPVHSELIRPLVWETTDELAAMVHQRLSLS